MNERRVTFPHMGSYWIAFKALAELVGAEAVVPPPMTRRTLELGSRHSPEFVCVPFKYNVGNFIEAMEMGANVVTQAGGGCRFSYYGEVQNLILADLGFEHEFINLTDSHHVRDMVRDLKRINPGSSTARVARAFAIAWAKAKAIEAVDDFVRKNLGFQVEPGEIERIERRFYREVERAMTLRSVRGVRRDAMRSLASVRVRKPGDRLRVGVVGELYVVMDPFCNYDIERRLAMRGVEVHRFVTLTSIIEHAVFGKSHLKELLHEAAPYIEYHVGAHGTESVALSNKLMREGFDGIVHLKPFGCMPEVNAMSALQRMSREHTFPIMFISYDSQHAEAGVLTRLEAFCDMLEMRRKRPGHTDVTSQDRTTEAHVA